MKTQISISIDPEQADYIKEFAKKEYGEMAAKPLNGMLCTVYFLKGDYEKSIELIETNFNC